MDAWESSATRLELCRRYLRDYPDSALGWRAYGTGLSDIRLFDEAEQALKRALELAPAKRRVFVLAHLGEMHQRRGDSASAERYYRDAVAADPDDAHGYIFLGSLMARDGRHDEAEATHRRGTKCLRGCIDEAHLNLGYILRAHRRYEEAIASFAEALRIDPHYKVAKLALKDCKQAMRIATSESL